MTPNGKLTLVEAMQALEAAIAIAPATETPSILGTLERLKAVVWSRLLTEQRPEQKEITGKTPMTAKDVAPLLGVQTTMVYELVRQNKLKFYKVGKYIRFRESDIQNFLAQGGA